MGQRALSVLNGLVDYYRYTGDPAAVAHLTYMGNFLLDHCLTPADHPWPGMFISVPGCGKAYYKADPHGLIQLDICAAAGQGLLRAYQLTGNARWLDAAKHWADLLAERCNLDPKAAPWQRYANFEDAKVAWKTGLTNKQTGGVTMILAFLDDMIRFGYTGRNAALPKARDAGRRYLENRLLPLWWVNDTWGHFFWDWENPVQNCWTTEDVARYLMDHPDAFDNWRCDARNIFMTLSQPQRRQRRLPQRRVQRGLGISGSQQLLRPLALVQPDRRRPRPGPVRRASGRPLGPGNGLSANGPADLRHPRDGRL